jgi:N-glycosylase/DNA lyase
MAGEAAPSSSSSSSSSSSKAEILLPVRDYDLAATLDSGQVFRWQPERGRPARVNLNPQLAGEPPALRSSWVGVVGKQFVRLTQTHDAICAKTAVPVADWQWLRDFLQTETDLAAVLKTFPEDEPMRAAVAACRGLRVLRQEPWECLASFILSSTKQIVQIRQIVSLLCERFGEPLAPGALASLPASSAFSAETRRQDASAPGDSRVLVHVFPTPERIADLAESDLRACKMGFRAPHLLAAARQIAEGKLDLETIRSLPLPEARAELMKLRGVGGKIADCVLLFAYGFDSAFPVDVWIERALRQLYFPRRRVSEKKLRHFAATHFGPHAGYAQQYLFHYMRTKMK